MVFYVAFYARPDDKARRQNLAGVEKANYIVKVFHDLGKSVTILSNAKSITNHGTRVEEVRLGRKGISLHTFASLRKGNRIWDILNAAYGLIQLFIYMVAHVCEGDIVCVYHSMGYRGLFSFLRKIKKFKYILEIEELFQYFNANQSSYKKKEGKVFLAPDAYIFSNKLMATEVNLSGKPSVIVSGVYQNMKRTADKTEGREKAIRLVYAGSLEPQKGIDKILDIAEYLNESFEVRIIGFGSEEDTQKVLHRVQELGQKGKMVAFDGIKTGQAYHEYLQQCDIGLCIQDDTDIFNKYEFPSKVISYMANGLNVISNDLIQIRTSEVADYINIVESNETKAIAEYINERRYKDIDCKSAMEELDSLFHGNLSRLLKQI